MGTEPTRVLVTNAEERSILAACRCLHAAGYEVGVVAFRPLAPTHGSRVAHAYFRITDPLPLLLRGLGMALSQAEQGTPTIDPGTPAPKRDDEPPPT
jgi:hypothetical protein